VSGPVPVRSGPVPVRSGPVPVRPDLVTLTGYHSPQVAAEVRINTNESPFPPPAGWTEAFEEAVAAIDPHRYPDRHARALRAGLAELHGVTEAEVFCANGSNEVLQCLLLAYGGPGRRAAMFEPTYALHRLIANITATPVVTGSRDEHFAIDPDAAKALVTGCDATITFLCSPNNPTGNAERPEVVERLLAVVPGLLVVDEAYVQFARTSALALRAGPRADRLVVVRTFSKTWSLAAVRLGYLVATPEVVAACEQVTLPYHLSAYTQAAGVVALRFRAEMEARVAVIIEERGRLQAALAELPVQSWPSDANFVLFRPTERDAAAVWSGLLERSVLVRDCSSWDGLGGCLRVSVGTPEENDRFLESLEACLR
jgi:histidinol-phosphate aminotransferase